MVGPSSKSPPKQSAAPRPECIFPRLEPSQPPTPAPPKVAAAGLRSGTGSRPSLSRCSRSEPSLLQPVEASCDGDCTPRGSMLSAVTTSFGMLPALAAASGASPPRASPSRVSAATCSAVESAAFADAPPATASAPHVLQASQASPQAPQQRRQPVSGVRYPVDCASSVCSTWQREYQKEPGIALVRGLRKLDPRYSNECSPGVCCVKEQDLPSVPHSDHVVDMKRRNIEYINTKLRELGVEATSQGPPVDMRPTAAGARSRGGGGAGVGRSVSEARSRREG